MKWNKNEKRLNINSGRIFHHSPVSRYCTRLLELSLSCRYRIIRVRQGFATVCRFCQHQIRNLATVQLQARRLDYNSNFLKFRTLKMAGLSPASLNPSVPQQLCSCLLGTSSLLRLFKASAAVVCLVPQKLGIGYQNWGILRKCYLTYLPLPGTETLPL